MKIAVTGHRQIAGTYWHPTHPTAPWQKIEDHLRRTLHTHIEALGPGGYLSDIQCITGMALGVDQAFAQVALDLDLTVHAYIPCQGQESQWPSFSQAFYRQLLSRIQSSGGTARYIHQGPYVQGCMHRRNEAMVHDADHLIAVWNTSPGGTAHCIRHAQATWKDASRITHIDPRQIGAEPSY